MSLRVESVLSGCESVDAFFARTHGDWLRIARYMMARHHIPLGIDESDVVQELTLTAWRMLEKFDATRSANADRYLVWNAIVRTRRWLRQQRRRGGRGTDAELVSLEATASNEDGHGPREQAIEAEQPQRLESREELERLLASCTRIKTAICLVAVWRTGDLSAAGEAIYDNQRTRRICRLDCRAEARQVVTREVARAARS